MLLRFFIAFIHSLLSLGLSIGHPCSSLSISISSRQNMDTLSFPICDVERQSFQGTEAERRAMYTLM